MHADEQRVAIFTRYPEAGKTKTRLIPALGPEGAASLQRKLTQETLRTAIDPRWSCVVYFAGGSLRAMSEWLGPEMPLLEQHGDSLGDRMLAVFRAREDESARRTVIIGTDAPALRPDHLHCAFESLHDVDVVLGPALDGGYYLIGARKAHPELFRDMPWGSNSILEQTVARLEQAELSYRLLEPLSDIDRPEDLAQLPKHWLQAAFQT